MRNFKSIIILLLCLTLFVPVHAQEELKVKSLKEQLSDLSARTNRRYDLNDVPCALIKVQYPKPGAVFEGTIVGETEFHYNEYWVFVSNGTKRLKIHIPGMPTINVTFADFGINQVESNTTYILNFHFPKSSSSAATSFYAEAGYVAGSTMGAEVALGMYISGLNIEASAMMPMASEQTVYWQEGDKMPEQFSYKPSLAFGLRVGYGIKAGESFRITPQAGIMYMGLDEKAVGTSSLTPAKGANCASATIGVKLQYMLSKNFSLCLTPQYSAAVAKSKGFEALADVSDEISKWNNGIGIKLAANIEF